MSPLTVSPARRAPFPLARAWGWIITLPVAVIAGLVTWGIARNPNAGLIAAAVCTAFGTFVLWFGYRLGSITNAYWMNLLALLALPASLLAVVFADQFQWYWVPAGDLVLIVLVGIAVGIYRAAKRRAGLGELVGIIIYGFVPGSFSE